ncbi:MAG: TetR/AcrR family transcriptional regulator [Planctomycetota bacterium]
MDLLSPKQIEIREREEKILLAARPMIVREGYHGFSMDRIAEAVKYSKGTIYNHFSCKEEIILALAAQTSAKRVELFQRAADYRAIARYRMVAIGQAAQIFASEYTDHFLFEEIIMLPSVREKTSEKRHAVIQSCEIQCMSIVAGIVRDAVASSDLVLPDNMSPEEIVFGLWALTSGGYSIILKSESLSLLGINKPVQTVRDHTAALMDGYDWRPLSKDFDMDQVVQQVNQKVFLNG